MNNAMNEVLESCFKQPLHELKALFDKAYELSRNNFFNAIHFYVPGMVHYETAFYQATMSQSFPGISITGRKCHLNCEHCKGTLLESMIPATTPEKLFETCVMIKRAGGRGCLISGGSLSDGSVPLEDFVSVIKRVKQELGLKVAVHTGLVQPSLAEALGEAHIDAAMIDIIGADETIKEVYHLNCSVDAFRRSLTLLSRNRIPIVPHVVVGIHYGRLRGEKQALETISKCSPAAVVIVALTPLEDTPMETVIAPSPLDIARVVLASRLLMPNVPLLLGCARPRGIHKVKTDILAIRAGVNGIAYPSEEACKLATKLGLGISFHEECCSLLWQNVALGETSRVSAYVG